MFCFFFFKQKTAYEMRISDWSSDVCSSDLVGVVYEHARRQWVDLHALDALPLRQEIVHGLEERLVVSPFRNANPDAVRCQMADDAFRSLGHIGRQSTAARASPGGAAETSVGCDVRAGSDALCSSSRSEIGRAHV